MAFEEQERTLPRVRLANLPTPLSRLAKLGQEIGLEQLWIKRDDLTGLATGGNKTRKLEFLIADALAKGADSVITAGGAQSNHCRQTAAAAARHDLECHLVLGGEPASPIGNSLLDVLLGAKLHWVSKPERNKRMQELATEFASGGGSPYVIPVGGSNAIGAVGYALAFHELQQQIAEQEIEIDRVVFATSSGGTQAGLVLGAKQAGFTGRITAISIDAAPDDDAFLQDVCTIANKAAQLMHDDTSLKVDDFDMEYGYLGAGYAVLGATERDAIKRVARSEGILVGPVYTGRAMGALIDMVHTGKVGANERVLFWHTGDETALHAYADELK